MGITRDEWTWIATLLEDAAADIKVDSSWGSEELREAKLRELAELTAKVHAELIDPGNVVVEIENSYEDGSSSKHRVQIPAPPVGIDFEVELPDWFQDKVWPHTGDGADGHENMNAGYLATIVATNGRDELVGEWFEWV